ncbi:unnamed protein product [Camellia sinensis]
MTGYIQLTFCQKDLEGRSDSSSSSSSPTWIWWSTMLELTTSQNYQRSLCQHKIIAGPIVGNLPGKHIFMSAKQLKCTRQRKSSSIRADSWLEIN